MSDSITKIEEVLDELESEFVPQDRPMQLLIKLRGRLEPLLTKSRPPTLNRPADEWVTALLEQAGNDLHAAETLDLNLQAPTVAMLRCTSPVACCRQTFDAATETRPAPRVEVEASRRPSVE
jgi:hypothetical protein